MKAAFGRLFTFGGRGPRETPGRGLRIAWSGCRFVQKPEEKTIMRAIHLASVAAAFVAGLAASPMLHGVLADAHGLLMAQEGVTVV